MNNFIRIKNKTQVGFDMAVDIIAESGIGTENFWLHKNHIQPETEEHIATVKNTALESETSIYFSVFLRVSHKGNETGSAGIIYLRLRGTQGQPGFQFSFSAAQYDTVFPTHNWNESMYTQNIAFWTCSEDNVLVVEYFLLENELVYRFHPLKSEEKRNIFDALQLEYILPQIRKDKTETLKIILHTVYETEKRHKKTVFGKITKTPCEKMCYKQGLVPYINIDGTESPSLENILPPYRGKWVGGWTIDTTMPATDNEGWLYAEGETGDLSSQTKNSKIRRRKWIRLYQIRKQPPFEKDVEETAPSCHEAPEEKTEKTFQALHTALSEMVRDKDKLLCLRDWPADTLAREEAEAVLFCFFTLEARKEASCMLPQLALSQKTLFPRRYLR
ncbi:MAG: uncharacterized protein A8A55_0756 [Amphiamblys sp. WSBS2006]|nr:MAG: uncharacterized protein A8A55_0756 [Amphiamblys sp. WSBS2006]